MDYQAALNKLKTLEVEGVADLVSAIEGKVSDLIGEKRNTAQRNMTLGETLEAVAKGLNLEGVVERDANGVYLLGDKSGDLPMTVQEIRRSKDTLQKQYDEASGKLTEAEGKAKTLERKTKLQEISAASGAVATVLEDLLGDRIAEVAITDGAAMLGDKPLREALEADERAKLYLPALFPAASTPEPEKPKAKLPGGNPGGEGEKTDPVNAYFGSTYKGIEALTKTT